MTEKNNDNKSLILYTSLIFGVAIVMIIVAFFAEKHLDNLRVSEVDAQNITLSNKAAQVSEENFQLVELNKNLRQNNETLTKQVSDLTAERDAQAKEIDGYKALIEVYKRACRGQKTKAQELLKGIYTEDLTQEQKVLYDELVKMTR